MVVRTDVTDLGSVEAMAAAALDRFGRIDVVVANSGDRRAERGAVGARPASSGGRPSTSTCTGVFHTARATIPAMIAGRAAARWS